MGMLAGHGDDAYAYIHADDSLVQFPHRLHSQAPYRPANYPAVPIESCHYLESLGGESRIAKDGPPKSPYSNEAHAPVLVEAHNLFQLY